MSRKAHVEEPIPHGAPRWYVGFSTLTTILMTFFITLTVRMGNERDLGYVGPGAGSFREAFNSHGMPGVLRGARRVVDFFTWRDKYQPEDAPQSAEGEVYTGRLLEMPERDLKQALTELAKSSDDVQLPLPLNYARALDSAGRERLAAAARLIRQSNRTVMVCATLPCDGQPTTEALCRATEWALLIGRHLADTEKVPSDRLTAVGRVSARDATQPIREPTVTLVLRPKVTYASAPGPLHQKPVTQHEVVR